MHRRPRAGMRLVRAASLKPWCAWDSLQGPVKCYLWPAGLRWVWDCVFLTGSQEILGLPVRDNMWRSKSLERCNFSLFLIENHNHRKITKLITWITALSNSMKLWAMLCRATQDGRWRVLTKRGPLEKGMANHFSILALRTPWTVWKGKKIGHWKMNSPSR